jgi:hypothetical protein
MTHHSTVALLGNPDMSQYHSSCSYNISKEDEQMNSKLVEVNSI